MKRRMEIHNKDHLQCPSCPSKFADTWNLNDHKNLENIETSVHDSITPFEAMFVRKPTIPNEMMHGVTSNSENIQISSDDVAGGNQLKKKTGRIGKKEHQRSKNNYDRRRNVMTNSHDKFSVESENIAGISFSTSSDLNKNNSEIKETTSTDDEEITCRQGKFLSFSEETTMQIFDIDISDVCLSDDDEDDHSTDNKKNRRKGTREVTKETKV
ncbi:unnamed protein product [Mytilus edulis]|uniref:Uncharacterized protein n=1 Tax=Mytilus edulis TaxID=6550 RepID=A0A8S3S7K7_MYTED|nr:unnamed protein product [Mytilus edulis]